MPATTIIQGVFDELTANAACFITELGLMLAMLDMIVAVIFARSPLPGRRRPASAMEVASDPAQAQWKPCGRTARRADSMLDIASERRRA
jgi:hypothetical protein